VYVRGCGKERWRRGGGRVSSRGKDDVVLFEGRISDPRRNWIGWFAVFRENDKADGRRTGGWDSVRLRGLLFVVVLEVEGGRGEASASWVGATLKTMEGRVFHLLCSSKRTNVITTHATWSAECRMSSVAAAQM